MLNEKVAADLADVLRSKFAFATTTDIDRAVAEIMKRTDNNQKRRSGFSFATAFRGLLALAGTPISSKSAESDINYTRALATGTSPGSYLVPTIQSEEFVEYLTLGGVARAAGVRVWDMAGVQKMNVVSALATPTFVWTGQNSAQSATDPNFGQLSFDLKERRALVAVPNQLLAVSVPAFDTLLASLLGAAAAEHEDAAMFSSTNVSGGPGCLMQAASITTLNVGGSGNGGNIAFTDLTATLAAASAAKAKGPFVWFSSPRTFWQRIYGLTDTSSRPLFIPTLTQGLVQGAALLGVAPVGSLLGYPIYVTPAISETEAVGSGSNQSHLILTNPKYLHIAQDGNVAIALSTERYFESNQSAIRMVNQEDMGYAPAAGITVLKGIN